MWRPAEAIALTPTQRRQLEQIARHPRTTQKVALRVAIILGAAEGLSNRELARRLSTSRPTVLLWRRRFAEAGVDGLLRDAPRPGRRKQLSAQQVAQILEATLEQRPREATHWSTRSLARRCRVSHMTVYRLWRAYGLPPHRVESFKLPTDPELAAKVRDIVGLYLNPPERALVLSVDEKSQIQALDRTQPILPLRPGLPERQTHDYIRHGTTTLFAALNVLDGKVIAQCLPRHRHTEFLQFLDQIERQTPKRLMVHLILDNYGTHTHPKVLEWLEAHPRYRFHFTPKGASWLNQVERFFAELTRQRIRRGTFRSVRELEKAIQDYVRAHNHRARPFVWTATASKIIRKVRRCKEVLVTGH